MSKKYYIIDKQNPEIVNSYIDYHQIKGYKIKPQNKIPYEGIEVGHLTLVEPDLIRGVIKRKTKIKLNSYLKFLMTVVDDDDEDPDNLALVIDDIERYKEIIMKKYSKFLDKRYIATLIKKVGLVERELKTKIKNINLDDEIQIGRRR